MGFFSRNSGSGNGGGPQNPPYWADACAFIHSCRQVAHPPDMEKPIPEQASPYAYAWFTAADWFRLRIYHSVLRFLEEQGVDELDALSLDAKRAIVMFAAPFFLTSDKVEALAARKPSSAEKLRTNHQLWQKALAEGPSRFRPGESVTALLKRLHTGIGLEAAYAQGADDLASGAWRERTRMWFLLPLAVNRDRGIVTGAPPTFGSLDAAERAAIGVMYRTLLSDQDSLHMMADAAAGEDPERPDPGIGSNLAACIYPFQASAGGQYVRWTVPDPLPTGRQAKSRHCPCDAALLLFQTAKICAAAGRPLP